MTWKLPSNFSGLQDMFHYINVESSNKFSLLIVMTVFFISFVSIYLGGQTTEKTLILSSFLTFIMGSLLWGAGILSGQILVLLLVMVVLSFIYNYITMK